MISAYWFLFNLKFILQLITVKCFAYIQVASMFFYEQFSKILADKVPTFKIILININKCPINLRVANSKQEFNKWLEPFDCHIISFH